MSQSLKDQIRKLKESRVQSAKGVPTYFQSEQTPAAKPPKDKEVKRKAGTIDQCFVIVPDVHSYQRDELAFKLFMKALPILAAKYNVTKFVQLGDLLEGGEFNGHGSSSTAEKKLDWREEIEWAMDDFWKPALAAFPKANFYAMFGNHENRADRFIADRIGSGSTAAQIFEDLMPTKLYEELGIHVTHYGREDVRNGVLQLLPNLYCVHGWSTAKNAAGAHLAAVTGSHSLIFGHTHRAQSDVRRDPITNEYIQGYSFGSLARTSMVWHKGHPMDHTLGFGLVFTHGKNFSVNHVPIIMDCDKRVMMLPTGDVLEG